MRSRWGLRGRRFAVAAWVLSAALGELRAADDLPAAESPRHSGTFSFRSENDIWAGNDNHYTNGIAASWTTPAIEDCRRPQPGFWCKVVLGFGWLPRVGDDGWDTFAAFELGQEMYTPDDISLPDPPPGSQPYAGILFWDTSLFVRSGRQMHAYTWRLGIVGPASGAEQTQRLIHRLLNVQVPQGWDTQLRNEPLINFDYRYHRRVIEAKERGFGYDLALSAGAGLGNYYIGGDAGVQLRFGHDLPDTFGGFDIRRGGEALAGLEASASGYHLYAFVQGQAQAIGRFLPVDGNTFKESRQGERDDFYTVLSAGVVAGFKRVLFSYVYNLVIGPGFIPAERDDDYGAIAIHYLF